MANSGLTVPDGHAVVKGDMAEMETTFGTSYNTSLSIWSPALKLAKNRRCRSAPAACPERLSIIRMKGRSARDPTVCTLLGQLCADMEIDELDGAVQDFFIGLKRGLNQGP